MDASSGASAPRSSPAVATITFSTAVVVATTVSCLLCCKLLRLTVTGLVAEAAVGVRWCVVVLSALRNATSFAAAAME
jgi:hypothetical protein